MASKRVTNNSSVSSLDEQSQVISRVLEAGEASSARVSEVPIDKVTSQPKRKDVRGKNKAARAAAKGRADSEPRDAPLAPGRVGDVTSRRERGESRAVAGQRAVVTLGDVDDVLGDDPGADPDGEQESARGAAQGLTDLELEPDREVESGLWDRQHWLWQQQQIQNMQMPGFMNYPCGDFPMQFWQPQMMPAAGVSRPAPSATVTRQQAHEISDEEDEIEELAQMVAAASPSVSKRAVGKTAGLIKEHLAQVKEADRISQELDPGVAVLLDKYLREATLPSEFEKLTKAHPRIGNVESMKVPRLEEEIFHAVDQRFRNQDMAFQGIQKGVLAAMATFAPLLDLTLARKDQDPELDDLGETTMEGFKLLAHVHNQISNKRKELLRPQISPIYAKALSKGSEELSQDWLFGGNLEETTKQCDVSRKITEKVAGKRKQDKGPGKGQQQFKKFRPPFPAQFGTQPTMLRPYNPYQMPVMPRFPNPTGFQQQQSYQYYPQGYPQAMFGGFPRRQRFARGGPRQQGFGKRGAHK